MNLELSSSVRSIYSFPPAALWKEKFHGEELQKAMKEAIREKDKELKGTMATQGTTPRRYTDLLGSLCDLTSGSGDKGTPVVLVQRYFTNYSND